MGLLAVLIVFIVGVVFLINLDTGDLKENQVIGIGFIAAAVAFLAGVSWPQWPSRG